MKTIRKRFSVREFVQFIMRAGDLNTTYTGRNRALEGTYAHQALQTKLSAHYGTRYEREVFLEKEIQVSGITLVLTGRADGIIHEDDGIIIDEIKSTRKELHELEGGLKTHWAQAEVYAYIYALEEGLDTVKVQLTYCDAETLLTRLFIKEWTFKDLEAHFLSMIDAFKSWSYYIKEWTKEREQSIVDLDFPFEYRKGQRHIAIEVYRAIRDRNKLYVQAPTGIGKTISVLFPTVKALGEELTKKVFYLTAKTITRTVAEESIRLLENKGLHLKSVTLTAKDKICFEKDATCNPDECQYAKGHYDRVNETIYAILQMHDQLDREMIEKYARHYLVCPFEMQLDLTEWADMVICDYNYVFDPRVSLKRYFEEKRESFTFLIDEAHNLVDRSREMYSASVYKERVMDIKRITKGRSEELTKKLEKVNRKFLSVRKLYEGHKETVMDEEPSELYGALREFVEVCDGYLQKERNVEIHQQVLEFYFEAVQFLKISELYDDAFRILLKVPSKKEVEVRLYCLDPSAIIKDIIGRNGTGIFFSATLLPLNYYHQLLGGEEADKVIELESPFDASRFELMIAGDVSTRLKDRDYSYLPIAKYIKRIMEAKHGNYIVFFPSYEYMEHVYDTYRELYEEQKTLVQTKRMSEEEREVFLEQFEHDPDESLLAFCVLGGIFSEGIDLRHDRLTGTIIVGVGLPRISQEQNLIRDHFEESHNMGYAYAYIYPGMTKVLQAAGRVIRTEEDKGVILLIGDRFNQHIYKGIYPRHWFPHYKVYNEHQVASTLKLFWDNSK